ncbi:hypothetical protein F4560_001821 [Saccharothrix ecbatanensis]|uniref:DUF3027 family protein n=2 Tax=Saccharothrix ecbatanensis TaxID=1105145 RepID=A0A7W9HGX3_9PSEU|nr:hypothetical protein [Saccharothrix ecbatanensis]
MTAEFDHVTRNETEMDSIHERWLGDRNRGRGGHEYEESWAGEQCGGCRFWVPLAGRVGHDYGVCANALSPFDGRVRFEHDGCDVFADAGRWLIPEDFG